MEPNGQVSGTAGSANIHDYVHNEQFLPFKFKKTVCEHATSESYGFDNTAAKRIEKTDSVTLQEKGGPNGHQQLSIGCACAAWAGDCAYADLDVGEGREASKRY